MGPETYGKSTSLLATFVLVAILAVSLRTDTYSNSAEACVNGDCAEIDASSLLQTSKWRAAPLPSADMIETSSGKKCPKPVDFFDLDKVDKKLPQPPQSYPEELKGILWMDQWGAYGSSTMSHPVPDFCVSFGDAHRAWDPKKKRIDVSVTGKGWTWWNNAEAYAFWALSEQANALYQFHFNDDLTRAQILPEADLGVLGRWVVPTWIVDASMTLLPSPPSGCPPAPGAPKDAINKCATWRRDTVSFKGTPFEQPGEVYYIFKIADAQGRRIQPYYSAYVQFALQSNVTDPDAKAAKIALGVDLKKLGGTKPAQSLVGFVSSNKQDVKKCAKVESPCKSLLTPAGFSRCCDHILKEIRII